jgi:putative membrane protein
VRHKTPNEAETGFVVNAASTSMLEVRLGDYALSHAASAPIREFAHAMIADHTRANRELDEAATKIDFKLPEEMIQEHKEEYARLTRLSGEAFDEAYVAAMVDGHEKAVEAFEAEIARSQSDVAKWAKATLPTLEKHLDHAHELAAQTADVAPAPEAKR